jgi:outer membrane protein OmpA-like peptidoglycan-associated protein
LSKARDGDALADHLAENIHFRGSFDHVTCVTFKALNPPYPSSIKTPSGVTARIKTMTRFHGLSGLKAITICAALSMSAGLALAGDNIVPADQIVNQLRPKPLTRGLSVGTPQVDPAVQAKEASFVATIRNRRTRSLSLGEREELAEISTTKPKIDLEIQFDFNSAEISKTSTQAVQELGKALSDPSLRGSTFVVAGNTDGIGGDAFNQDLSERRADTIKRYLVQNYGLAASDLVTVGYGKSRLKDANDPADPINRRVEVVNMETKTASK